MKYLGLVLDSRWNFQDHFRRLAPKLIGSASALSRLLPNVGGRRRAAADYTRAVVRSDGPVLSGHGCFGKYLCKIARGRQHQYAPLRRGRTDTAQHTLQMCPAFEGQRGCLKAVIGNDLSLPAVVKSMTDSESRGSPWPPSARR
ncbi:uncharacterized protein [Choristoneura fumiferana]|uniref:uncharacterized protein n=1 Tax=Choristoneura fumiferana TaxID=7141 RepID=UPI003D153A33